VDSGRRRPHYTRFAQSRKKPIELGFRRSVLLRNNSARSILSYYAAYTNNIYTVCNVQTSWLLYTLVYSPRIATMEYPIVGLIILYYYDHLPQSGSDSLSFRALSALKACGFSTVLFPCSIWHSSCLIMPIVSVCTRIRLYKVLPGSVRTPPSESFPYVL
jgi:hypothetical protein